MLALDEVSKKRKLVLQSTVVPQNKDTIPSKMLTILRKFRFRKFS